ncbi:hypothetical protein AYI70_g4436 [Smittium culicis]|uniref:Uncharacterized protein n=1 Tax=Smittium culicis TaxID=133412 RepID=A0A1R1XYZ7_9FUNG|nr:hypothetical protein AYI70_g4436 [Smittium culicis]
MNDSGEIPSCMTTSIIVPVPKKGDMKDPDNYRGISLMPTIIKLLAKVEPNFTLSLSHQFGFNADWMLRWGDIWHERSQMQAHTVRNRQGNPTGCQCRKISGHGAHQG